jgi:uncharacterized protein
LRKFVNISIAIFAVFFIMITGFAYFYRYSTINTYNYILLIVLTLTIITLILFVFSGLTVYYTYKRKKVGIALYWLNKIGLKILLPFVIFVSGVFNSNKNDIRKIYVEINNILVQSKKRKYLPEDVLLLLPHCLQNSECGYKVTNNIGNCHRCGKCCIGDISEIANEKGISAVVVTGGTIARKIVSEHNPKLVLSVACERDLTSGIADIGNVPAVGVINERPNGPCFNTHIDANIIKESIEKLI